jgi:hypothetical protein
MGWCDPLVSSMNQLIVTGTDCTIRLGVEMVEPSDSVAAWVP